MKGEGRVKRECALTLPDRCSTELRHDGSNCWLIVSLMGSAALSYKESRRTLENRTGRNGKKKKGREKKPTDEKYPRKADNEPIIHTTN